MSLFHIGVWLNYLKIERYDDDVATTTQFSNCSSAQEFIEKTHWKEVVVNRTIDILNDNVISNFKKSLKQQRQFSLDCFLLWEDPSRKYVPCFKDWNKLIAFTCISKDTGYEQFGMRWESRNDLVHNPMFHCNFHDSLHVLICLIYIIQNLMASWLPVQMKLYRLRSCNLFLAFFPVCRTVTDYFSCLHSSRSAFNAQ